MLRILVPTAALVLGAALAQPAAAQSGVELVKQAVAAQGGAAAIGAPKTTIIKGEAKHWEPGQSYSPTGEARFLGDATYTQTVDNAARTARIDWDRDMKYPAVERLKYSEITTPTTRPTIIKGADTTTNVMIASRATSSTSGPVIASPDGLAEVCRLACSTRAGRSNAPAIRSASA